jgi:hypothetical protein
VALLSAAYRWDRPTMGVLLTDGVTETELASALPPLATTLSIATPARPYPTIGVASLNQRSSYRSGGVRVTSGRRPGRRLRIRARPPPAQERTSSGRATRAHGQAGSDPLSSGRG